jgi:hypothetical protein
MSAVLRGATRLPDGTLVRGRSLRDPLPEGPLPDYGLYLVSRPSQQQATTSLQRPRWNRRGRRRRFEPSWEADWILWPDFRTPADPPKRPTPSSRPSGGRRRAGASRLPVGVAADGPGRCWPAWRSWPAFPPPRPSGGSEPTIEPGRSRPGASEGGLSGSLCGTSAAMRHPATRPAPRRPTSGHARHACSANSAPSTRQTTFRNPELAGFPV